MRGVRGFLFLQWSGLFSSSREGPVLRWSVLWSPSWMLHFIFGCVFHKWGPRRTMELVPGLWDLCWCPLLPPITSQPWVLGLLPASWSFQASPWYSSYSTAQWPLLPSGWGSKWIVSSGGGSASAVALHSSWVPGLGAFRLGRGAVCIRPRTSWGWARQERFCPGLAEPLVLSAGCVGGRYTLLWARHLVCLAQSVQPLAVVHLFWVGVAGQREGKIDYQFFILHCALKIE